ncbi:MAG: hypothetical protein Q8Q73_05845 [Stagnimonas sp.]|nr:hypothetical protein [Stagnimonas sp.]
MASGRHALLALPLLLWLPAASAHVKWLHPALGAAHLPPVPPYSLREAAVVIGLELLVGALLLARQLDLLLRRAPGGRICCHHGLRHWPLIRRAMQLLLGVALLSSSFDGALLAPHLRGTGASFALALLMQAGAGLLLVLDRLPTLAAGLVAVLGLLLLPLFGAQSFCEYLLYLGLAAVLGQPGGGPPDPERLRALRICLGLSLVTLACTEKLLDPQLALELLRQAPLNFMAALGLDFPDRLFVLSAGYVELLFGGLFLTGALNRLNGLALLGFLLASNSYFLWLGDTDSALLEAAGHAPLLAALLPLLCLGRGAEPSYQRLLARRGHQPPHPPAGFWLPAPFANCVWVALLLLAEPLRQLDRRLLAPLLRPLLPLKPENPTAPESPR